MMGLWEPCTCSVSTYYAGLSAHYARAAGWHKLFAAACQVAASGVMPRCCA